MIKRINKKSLKAPAIAAKVPQSKEEAAQAISRIGAAQRERQRIEAEMNDRIAAVKEQYEALAEPHSETITALRAGVQTWCEANRQALTQGGKVKSATFTTGEVKWRVTPPSVSIKGIPATIELLKKRLLERFVRTKEEINKDAILAEPEAVRGIASIIIEQREEFVIEPFEASLDEVA